MFVSPYTLKFAEITALIPFSTPTGISTPTGNYANDPVVGEIDSMTMSAP